MRRAAAAMTMMSHRSSRAMSFNPDDLFLRRLRAAASPV